MTTLTAAPMSDVDHVNVLAPETTTFRAVARHVTHDGCQFVFREAVPGPAQRLTLVLEGNSPVSGVVRWIVTDRAGFAFDHGLDAEAMAELSNRSALVSEIELQLEPVVAND